MKAIVQDRFGPPDVLELRDVEVPDIGDGEVRLRVHAAGIDPGVVYVVAGVPYLIRLAGFGLRSPRKPVPGLDVAGVVESVGAKVTDLEVGDEVYGVAHGSLAEHARADPAKLAPKPAGLTWEQAAAVPVSGLTALQALRDKARVRAGQRVLVLGAGGGVGTHAVQIAKALGAEVTGVCSTDKVDLVASLGADDVVDYTSHDVTRGERRWHVILDIAGLRPLSRLRRVLTPMGTLVLVGGHGGGRLLGPTGRILRAMALAPYVRHRLRPLLSIERRQDLLALTELIDAGKLSPVVDRTYPLADAADALRHVATGHAAGKTVVTI